MKHPPPLVVGLLLAAVVAVGLIIWIPRMGQTKTLAGYIEGEPQNERDGVLRGISDSKARASVIVPFSRLPGSPASELTAKFDVVMGYTPQA